MTVLTDSQIAGYLKNAGFPQSALPTGVSVALAESGGRTDAINHNSNGTTDKGFMQINSIHNVSGDLYDPAVNAAAAYSIWKAAGNSWVPWSTYPIKSAAYIVRGAVAAGSPAPITSTVPTTVVTPGGNGSSTLAKATAGGLWLRVGAFLLGTILLILGVQQMMGVNRTIVHVVRSAVKVKGI